MPLTAHDLSATFKKAETPDLYYRTTAERTHVLHQRNVRGRAEEGHIKRRKNKKQNEGRRGSTPLTLTVPPDPFQALLPPHLQSSYSLEKTAFFSPTSDGVPQHPKVKTVQEKKPFQPRSPFAAREADAVAPAAAALAQPVRKAEMLEIDMGSSKTQVRATKRSSVGLLCCPCAVMPRSLPAFGADRPSHQRAS